MGKITGNLRVILGILGSGVAIARLLASLLLIWLTLGWRVRKARKAFEKELIKQGMPKRDAKRISAQYADLKDSLINTVKRFLRG